jgi:hypothetical protein
MTIDDEEYGFWGRLFRGLPTEVFVTIAIVDRDSIGCSILLKTILRNCTNIGISKGFTDLYGWTKIEGDIVNRLHGIDKSLILSEIECIVTEGNVLLAHG